MYAIGIDPSLACTGIACMDFESRTVAAWDVIQTKPDGDARFKSDDLAERLWLLKEELQGFMSRHKGVPVIEAQTSASFGKAAMGTVGKLMAAYSAAICAMPVRPITVPPHEVKRVLTGRTGATKAECWDAARTFFDFFPPEPRSKAAQEAVHDAVCVAVAGRADLFRLKALNGGPTS